jgi:hypothetical protein
LRGAYFEAVKRTAVGGQTIEPTQIDGFNQIFDDDNGTKSRRWGLGFDQKIANRLFAGIEGSQRRLGIPMVDAGPPTVMVEQPWKEDVAHAYLDWIASERVSLIFGLRWEHLVRDPNATNTQNYADLDLLRAPLEIRYSDSSGLFALLRTTFVQETGHFLETNNFTLFGGRSTFAVVDAGIGWRVPGRAIVGSLQVENLLNSRFRFQDTDPTNPTIIPRRVVMGRLTVSF